MCQLAMSLIDDAVLMVRVQYMKEQAGPFSRGRHMLYSAVDPHARSQLTPSFAMLLFQLLSLTIHVENI